MDKKIRSSIYLVIVAIIWGLAFVAQTTGMDYLGPFGFSMTRSLVAGIMMYLITIIIPKFARLDQERIEGYIDSGINRKAGLVCGVVLFLAMNTQQIGLQDTTTGKAGFITALYIVIIPIIRRLMGNKINKRVFACVIVAMFGMYLLSVKENFGINVGDIVVFISAVFYSVHTLVLSYYSVKTDSLRLNMYQFLVCGVLSGITSIILKENISFYAIKMAMVSILYVGILSSGFAYTLQIIALRNIDPTIAALINSLEAIFAALGGYLILNQVLSAREIVGCAIMFIAIIVAQLPSRKGEQNG